MLTEAERSLRTTLRIARLAQVLTVGWMAIEGAIALGAGFAARSVALTAFGFDSAVELFSASVLLQRLLRRAESEERGSLSDAERTASRLVGWALWILVGYVAVSTIASLLFRVRAEASGIGLVLTATSIVVMLVLWRWRLGLAEHLRSPALRADAACSATCLWMAATTMIGVGANKLLGWWWADPVAALGLVVWLRREALEASKAARTGDVCCE